MKHVTACAVLQFNNKTVPPPLSVQQEWKSFAGHLNMSEKKETGKKKGSKSLVLICYKSAESFWRVKVWASPEGRSSPQAFRHNTQQIKPACLTYCCWVECISIVVHYWLLPWRKGKEKLKQSVRNVQGFLIILRSNLKKKHISPGFLYFRL